MRYHSNLYKGLTAGLFRQATYTTTRLGLYNSLMDAYAQRNGGRGAVPDFMGKLGIACVSGGIGIFILFLYFDMYILISDPVHI